MNIGARTTGGLVSVVVSTGGTNYTSPPSVSVSGGGGTGASVQAELERGRVASISVVTAGTGYTSAPSLVFSGGGGTGAAATAYAHTGTLRPMRFFRGRTNDLYGVDGMGRGVRWDGAATSVQPIGLRRPAAGPTLASSSSAGAQYVSGVQIVAGGAGYSSAPQVSFSGGSATTQAQGTALISGGRVVGVRVTAPGSGYQSAPTVTLSGGLATGATFSVSAVGRAYQVFPIAQGSGYTTLARCTAGTDGIVHCANHGLAAGSSVSFDAISGGAPITTGVNYYAVSVGANTLTIATAAGSTASTVVATTAATAGVLVIPPPVAQFSTAQGLTGAVATLSIGDGGGIEYAAIIAGGTGATTGGVTASVIGGGGTGAQLGVSMQFAVNSVSVVAGGTGFYTEPVVTFRAASQDSYGRGAAATAGVSNGSVASVNIIAGGEYYAPPSAVVLDSSARAVAAVSRAFSGKYYCALRYIDSTPENAGGPLASSISDLVEVDTGAGASSLTWNLAHHSVDDRVHAVELWRSSADQAVVLYKVTTILRSNAAFSQPYADTLTDRDLQDAQRDGFKVLPVTLPSGQINARRFGVPPGNYAEVTMFQDRAWYAVDTTGARPNSLMFSEVDEPESVPETNELVVQENTATPDRIVALAPLGSQLLVMQQSHLYRLNYVAQPVIDASLTLGAYRGILNSRCWAAINGVAFIADSNGMYAYDGNSEEAVSVAVDDLWRDGRIDLSKSDQFHVSADPATKVVRLFYCTAADTQPVRALCYCVTTKSWWEEAYAVPVTASASAVLSGRRTVVYGGGGGQVLKFGGFTDLGSPVSYVLLTGPCTLVNEDSRSIGVVYQPTSAPSVLDLRLHYNNSPSHRPNAITSERGGPVVATADGAALDMRRQLSLGESNGFARAYYSGRIDDRSVGGDRHLAVRLSGEQSSDPVTIYGMRIDGVQ